MSSLGSTTNASSEERPKSKMKREGQGQQHVHEQQQESTALAANRGWKHFGWATRCKCFEETQNPGGTLCLPRLCSQNVRVQFLKAQPQTKSFKAAFGGSSEGDRQAHPSSSLLNPSSTPYCPEDCLFTSHCRCAALDN